MGCTMTTQNGLAMQRDESPATRIFKVTNVDNNGEDRNPGYIEITADSLVLRQRHKDSVAWPLHGLRRYGYDADLFSFESGRRCPTGPGIYAFRCRHAETLFNLLQSSIVVAGQSSATATSAARQAGRSLVESARRRSTVQGASTVQSSNRLVLQPVAVVRPLRTQMTLSEYRNVPVDGDTGAQLGHIQRQSLAQLPDILAMYRQHSDPPVHYAELDLARHVDDEESVEDEEDVDVFAADESHLSVNRTEQQSYVNVWSDNQHIVNTAVRHGYANLDLIADSGNAGAGAGSTKVNYIQLDLSTETLDAAGEESPAIASPASVRTLSLMQHADVGHNTDNSYTTIDFDRTRALNTISVESSLGIADEGVRRTRHNSNIV